MAQVRAKTVQPRKRKQSTDAALANPAERPLKIGEAARILGVEAYVLRFWETQFTFLRPKHSRSRHRFYGQSEIETLQLIKRLLHIEGYTIAGAKKHIREVGFDSLRGEASVSQAPDSVTNSNSSGTRETSEKMQRALAEIRSDLRSLHKLLKKDSTRGGRSP
jgi:DNA-binding transcriptional MerR regulator